MSEPGVANKSFLDKLAQAAILIAAAALIGVVFVQGWQVIARYVLNDSPGWTEPMALLLLNIAMSFGAAAGVHVRVISISLCCSMRCHRPCEPFASGCVVF